MAKIDINNVNIRLAEPKEAENIAVSDKSIVILAEIGGKMLGYADVWQVVDELQLNYIEVIEEYRGNHIARELLKVLADAGRELGCKVLNLEVREGNTSARALYQHAGFQEVGKREGYYIDNGETAILMDLKL